MSGEILTRLSDPVVRHTAFQIEQMAPGGTERQGCGVIRARDLDHAVNRLSDVLGRPSTESPRRKAVQSLKDRALELSEMLEVSEAAGLIYLGEKEHRLQQRLKSAAIEIDFCFGDRDGLVGAADITEARRRYGQVRGPVGWNRLLITDEIERQLYPERTLRTTEGLRLLPEDWLVDGPDPLHRLRVVIAHLDDAALARTYADIAARLATVAIRNPASHLSIIFESALQLLGSAIRDRNSIRPTITDIARIGCEDPEVKALLRTPIEMSRRLLPKTLLDRFLEPIH